MKFQIGDEVRCISHEHTLKCWSHAVLQDIGEISIVSVSHHHQAKCIEVIELVGNGYTFHVDDYELVTSHFNTTDSNAAYDRAMSIL